MKRMESAVSFLDRVMFAKYGELDNINIVSFLRSLVHQTIPRNWQLLRHRIVSPSQGKGTSLVNRAEKTSQLRFMNFNWIVNQAFGFRSYENNSGSGRWWLFLYYCESSCVDIYKNEIRKHWEQVNSEWN